MGDLSLDTAVRESEGSEFDGMVIRAWDGFIPNGGFLAAMSLRAVAERARIHVPRSVQCQFLRSARHGSVTLCPVVLGQSGSSDIIQVTANQNGTPVLTSLVRTLAHSEVGVTRDIAHAPDVPDPDFLRPTEDLLPPEMLNLVPLTRNFEVRPVTWERIWPPPPGRNPAYLAWCRFRPVPVFDDPFVSVGRYLVLLDSYAWAAVERGTGGGNGLFAVTTDLSVTIDDEGLSQEWLLVDVTVPVMRNGSISATGTIWSRDGARLAAGVTNMVYRPIRE